MVESPANRDRVLEHALRLALAAGGNDVGISQRLPSEKLVAWRTGSGEDPASRAEAMKLGLIDRNTQIEPEDRGFNDDLQASPDVRDRALKSALQDLFQGFARFDSKGVLRWGSATAENAGFDPDQPRAGGRWTVGGPNIRASRDFLGRKPAAGEQHLLPQHNIERARAAIDNLRRRRRAGVPDALYSPTLGKVEIPWGREGSPKPDENGKTYADGYGLSHILKKHGPEAAKALPETLAKGDVLAHPDPDKRYVVYKNWQAIIGKTSPHSAWAITNFDPLK
jgi:hypothetical protein